MKTLTPNQIQTVVEAQQQIINNPVKAVVNSESTWVRQLISETDYELSTDYWMWVCSNCSKKNLTFSDTLIRGNQEILESVDRTVTMPSWGYSNT
jgi:hypothetical protein